MSASEIPFYSLSELIHEIGGTCFNEKEWGGKLSDVVVQKAAPLLSAKKEDVSFFFSKDFQNEFLQSKAGVIVTGSAFVPFIKQANPPQLKSAVLIACDDPYLAMAKTTGFFAKRMKSNLIVGVHVTSVVHPSATVSKDAFIGPHCVIEAGVTIEKGAQLKGHVFVGENSKIGEASVLYPFVSIYPETVIGKRTRIHSNATIGADGFGYAPVIKNGDVIAHEKIHHFGKVAIGDDVEIGANSCIDRATFGETKIGNQVKIDNQVMVGHNSEIGEGSVLCGQTGLSGGSKLGKFVYMGARSGVGLKARVADRTEVAANSGIFRDTTERSKVAGYPSRPIREFLKLQVVFDRLIKDSHSKKKEKET